MADKWGMDAHSHSYFTLEELKKYDWNKYSTKLRGWVNATQYRIFKMKGKPEDWSGGIMGPNIRHLTHEQMEAEIAAGTIEGAYTQVEWTHTYADAIGPEFLKHTIPKLEAIRGKQKDSEVRIVFWFDN